MKAALAAKPVVDFVKPDTVVTATIDPGTGMLATPECTSRRDEFFIAGTEPTQYCPKHGGESMPPLTPAQPPQPPLSPLNPAQPPQAPESAPVDGDGAGPLSGDGANLER